MYQDGLHPSAIGSYLAAAAIYSKLLNRTPKGLPLTIRTRNGLQITLSQATATIVQGAAAAVNGF
jgi:hypothetical protein